MVCASQLRYALQLSCKNPNSATGCEQIGSFPTQGSSASRSKGLCVQIYFLLDCVQFCVQLQGFHWFAHEAALGEIHRVLRPGGGLALLWNREDDGAPWAAELLQVFEPLSRGIPQYWTGDWVRVWEGDYAKKHFDAPDQDPRSRSRFFRWGTLGCMTSCSCGTVSTFCELRVYAKLMLPSSLSNLDAAKIVREY